MGRKWQCATIQVDFAMPERFDLNYVDSDGERKRPVMLHRVILGAIERFMGVLIEHYAANSLYGFRPCRSSYLTSRTSRKIYRESARHCSMPMSGRRSTEE